MRQTINQWLVAIRKLALRKVDGQPFKTADIQICYELYDAHGLRNINGEPASTSP
jgi:hypothetical protein